MMFAEIIREAGINPVDLPKAAELPIVLYDGKPQKILKETLDLDEPIFEKNFKARIAFLKFLVDLERRLRTEEGLAIHSIRVQMTSAILVVGFGLATPHVFSRLPQLS